MRCFRLLPLVLLAATLLLPLSAHAQTAGNFGLGVIVGSPTGITGKHHFRGRPLFVDWAAGLPIVEHRRGLHAHATFLWQPTLVNLDRAVMDLYFGIGPKVFVHPRQDDLWLGARAPLGLDFNFKSVPIEVFIELSATLYLVGGQDFGFDGAAGFRWWF
jgi:hypothetical protein